MGGNPEGRGAEEQTQECVAPRILLDPGQPAQTQIDDHRIDHLFFRSWCPRCVAGRATGEQHQQRNDEKRIPTFSMDYLFLTRSRVADREALLEGGEVEMKALVAKDSQATTVFAHIVSCTEPDEEGYVATRITEDIGWLGHMGDMLKVRR